MLRLSASCIASQRLEEESFEMKACTQRCYQCRGRRELRRRQRNSPPPGAGGDNAHESPICTEPIPYPAFTIPQPRSPSPHRHPHPKPQHPLTPPLCHTPTPTSTPTQILYNLESTGHLASSTIVYLLRIRSRRGGRQLSPLEGQPRHGVPEAGRSYISLRRVGAELPVWEVPPRPPCTGTPVAAGRPRSRRQPPPPAHQDGEASS